MTRPHHEKDFQRSRAFLSSGSIRTAGRTLASLLVPALLAASAGASVANAQVFDEDYGSRQQMVLKGSAGLFSDRWFRGQNLYNGTSIQPKVEGGIGTGYGLLYVGAFAHFSGDNNTDGHVRRDFSELDWEIGHRFALQEMDLGVGHRWYTYSRSNERLVDTEEFFAELTTQVIAHPHFTAAYDYSEHDGWYYEAGLEQPIPVGLDNSQNAVVPWVTLGMSASLDGGEHPIYDDDGIAFVDVGVRGVFVLTDDVTLEPEMHYSEEVDDATTSDFVFGINLKGSVGESKS